MKSQFRAYFSPTEEELAEIWGEGLLVLDANALLNFFRYTPATRDAFFSVLDSKGESLWIPHQVGLEFHRNRHAVIADQKQAFGKTLAALETIQKYADGELDKLQIKRHIALDVQRIKSVVKTAIDELATETKLLKDQHDQDESPRTNDETLSHIATLYEGRVGAPYADEQLAKIYAEGKARYAKRQPPGYKDSSKGDPAMYGDLVLWKQVLDMGLGQKKPTIFVTEDVKEDWWLEVAGEKKGPRPELVEEYIQASGKRIYFYTPERFLNFARKRGLPISIEAQEEVEEVSDAGRRAMVVGMDRGFSMRPEVEPSTNEALIFSRSSHSVRAVEILALAARQRFAKLSTELEAAQERLAELEETLFDYEGGGVPILPIEEASAERARVGRDILRLRMELDSVHEVIDEADDQLHNLHAHKRELARRSNAT